ncbi:UpxY family transcription antiterminator [Pseudopedobacter saltans]|nr:UpxY family transcription antiterminator [Pseudopedobacter saltans]
MENLYKRDLSKQWFVIYTRTRWEKKVDTLLKQKGIDSYCPLKKVRSKWADRIKTVELPLFTSYVFVNINYKEELKVRQTHGVINFIYYMGKPAVVRNQEIEEIQDILVKNREIEVSSIRDLNIGDRVLIKNGALFNQEGNIVQVAGKTVLMLLNNLDCAIYTRVPVEDLVKK